MLTDEDCEMLPDAQATKRDRETSDTPVARKAASIASSKSVDLDCYFTLKPFGPAMGKENRPDQPLAILKGFSKAMVRVGSSIPVLPRRGQARHRGVHCMYGFTQEEVELATSLVTVISFTFEGVECEYMLGWMREALPERKPDTIYDERIARQQDLKDRDWSAAHSKGERDASSTHVIVFAQEGWVFFHVQLKQVKASFIKMGLVVLSSSRPGTKFENNQIDGTMHEVMHFNVTGACPATKWPQYLAVEVQYEDSSSNSGYVTCDLEYNILDEDLDKVMCTRGSCHRPIDMLVGLCACKRLSGLTSSNFKEMQTRKAGDPRGAREHAPKPPSGACSFLESLAIPPESVMCRHVSAGKCWGAVEGKKCQFMHPPVESIAIIHCKLRRSGASSAFCQNGPKCLYNHEINQRTPKSLQFGEAASSTC